MRVFELGDIKDDGGLSMGQFSSQGVETGSRKAVLRKCVLLLSAIHVKCWRLTFKVHLGKRRVSSDLNGMYQNTLNWRRLESKDFQAWDMVFLFVAVIMDRATREELDYPMSGTHNMYPEVGPCSRRKDRKDIVSEDFLGYTGVEVQKFQLLLKDMFDGHCQTSVRILEFHHLLEEVMKNLHQSGSEC